MKNKDKNIDELKQTLSENIDKAVAFAESNTRKNANGEVIWDEGDE